MSDARGSTPHSHSTGFGRRWWLVFGVLGAGLLIYAAVNARGGVPDPTAPGQRLSHGAVVLDSAILVLREGLEGILVLAAITASLRAGDTVRRRPVAGGAALALGTSVLTWFAAVWLLGALGGRALDVEAATGLLAVAVLLVVMNWFFHRLYWTGWIAHHHRRRRRALTAGGRGVTVGLLALGFTAVYREGFEVVIFLQNLRLQYGATTVLEGVALGLAFTAVLGVLTFSVQSRLPYKRMLVLTGATIGVVLIVMVGESAQELQAAGWISTTPVGVSLPGWIGTWLAVFPTVETLAAQALAATAVIGSYLLAEHLRVRRPARRGLTPAQRPERPPAPRPIAP